MTSVEIAEIIRRRGTVLIQVGGLTLVARPTEILHWVDMVKCSVDTTDVPALQPARAPQLEYNVRRANVMPMPTYEARQFPPPTFGAFPGRRPRKMRI